MKLNAIANTFSPIAKSHMLRKKVTWHVKGITSVKRFIIKPCDALPKRTLKGTPLSQIKIANPGESNPFKIPEATEEELDKLRDDELHDEEFIDWTHIHTTKFGKIIQTPVTITDDNIVIAKESKGSVITID